MNRWNGPLNEMVGDTEKMLSKATDEGLQDSMMRFVSMDADDVLAMSHADRTLMLGFATLALLYLLHRREEAKVMKEGCTP